MASGIVCAGARIFAARLRQYFGSFVSRGDGIERPRVIRWNRLELFTRGRPPSPPAPAPPARRPQHVPPKSGRSSLRRTALRRWFALISPTSGGSFGKLVIVGRGFQSPIVLWNDV